MSIYQFQARHDQHRPRSSWHHVLDMADSEAEVVARLREFISSFTPYEIESMPAELRPGKVVDGRDVSEYAVELVQAQLSQSQSPDLINAFSDVFGYAASRLSTLASRGPASDQETA